MPQMMGMGQMMGAAPMMQAPWMNQQRPMPVFQQATSDVKQAEPVAKEEAKAAE